MFDYEIDMSDVTKKLGKISGAQFERAVVEPVLKDMATTNAQRAGAGSPQRSGALSKSFTAKKVGGVWTVVSSKVYAPIQQWIGQNNFSTRRFATKPLKSILGRSGMKTVEKRIKQQF